MVLPLTLDFRSHAKSHTWKLKYQEAESFKWDSKILPDWQETELWPAVLASRVMCPYSWRRERRVQRREGFSEEIVSTILYVPFEQNLTRRRLKRRGKKERILGIAFSTSQGSGWRWWGKTIEGSKLFKKKKRLKKKEVKLGLRRVSAG